MLAPRRKSQPPDREFPGATPVTKALILADSKLIVVDLYAP